MILLSLRGSNGICDNIGTPFLVSTLNFRAIKNNVWLQNQSVAMRNLVTLRVKILRTKPSTKSLTSADFQRHSSPEFYFSMRSMTFNIFLPNWFIWSIIFYSIQFIFSASYRLVPIYLSTRLIVYCLSRF